MKKPLLKSVPMAWGAMLLIAIVLVCTFQLRTQWWAFIDIFFFFMMAFCHAVACTVARMGASISRRLDTVAMVCGILGVVSFIVEWALYAWVFDK